MTTHTKILFGLAGGVLSLAVSAGAPGSADSQAAEGAGHFGHDCTSLMRVIHTINGDADSLKKEEMALIEMSIPRLLDRRSQGNVDVGECDIPDRALPCCGGRASAGSRRTSRCCPSPAAVRDAPRASPILSMLHYHGDDAANANAFAKATGWCGKVERDRMFAEEIDSPVPDPSNDSDLKYEETVLIDKDEWDVFGDGAT